MRSIATLVVLAILAATNSALSADWPRFRGPNGSGIAADNKPVPTTWSPTKNLKWKVALPGPGASSPIVVGERVFVTCYSGYGLKKRDPGNIKDLKRHVVCVDRANGQVLWQKTVAALMPEDPFSSIGVSAHGYASHTPVSDGKRIYVYFGKTGAIAFDMDGKQLWQKILGKQSDPRQWGSSSSPILYENILIVTASAEARALFGLDATTGKQLWKAESDSLESVWGTPVLSKAGDKRTDLVIAGDDKTWGLDPRTGETRWFNRSLAANKSSAVESDGVIYSFETKPDVFNGPETKSGAIRAGGKSDTTKSHLLWTTKAKSSIGTSIVHEGRAYLVARGIVTCLNTKTGKEIYRARLQWVNDKPLPIEDDGFGFGRRIGSYSSPVIANDHLFYTKASGATYVLKTGDSFKQVAANRVTNDVEVFNGTPAISDGEIFLRSTRHLYCVSRQ